MHLTRVGIALLAVAVTAQRAEASITSFISSSLFEAAIAGDSQTIETFGSGTNNQVIPSGGSFGANTYSFTGGGAVSGNTLLGGIITNLFNSVSGLSLGGQQSDGDDFFFGGDSVTVTFPNPVDAVGVFFNVNLDSGLYQLAVGGASVATGSATYDTSTFVFDGIISSTPFTSATFSSTDLNLGSFNIPEFITATAVPEPVSLSLLGIGVLGAVVARRRYRRG